jgi:hypothetical protein
VFSIRRFHGSPLQRLNAIWCQLKHIEAAISNKAIVRGCCYRNPVVEPGRVPDGITLETLCSVLEHVARRHSCRLGLDSVILSWGGHIMGRSISRFHSFRSLVFVGYYRLQVLAVDMSNQKCRAGECIVMTRKGRGQLDDVRVSALVRHHRICRL